MLPNNVTFFFLSGCRVLICDFHREQAWERWTKKTENNVKDHRLELLALMRNVARAESEEDLKAALELLQSHSGYTTNLKFQKYFKNTWLASKELRLRDI